MSALPEWHINLNGCCWFESSFPPPDSYKKHMVRKNILQHPISISFSRQLLAPLLWRWQLREMKALRLFALGERLEPYY